MATRFLLGLAMLVASMQAWCQVEPSASGGEGSAEDDSLMSMPTPVSGAFYPSAPGDRERSNYLSGGVAVVAAYNDNVLTRETVTPVGAETYEIRPDIRLEQRTSRTDASMSYDPGFVFYHPTSELNSVSQNANGSFEYRMTPHSRLSIQEVFQQNSTVFSQPYSLSGATINGSGDPNVPIILAPYVGQYSTFSTLHLSYQPSRSGMVGVSGNFGRINFSNTTQSIGLYDANSGGGTAFYTRRLTRTQFIGMEYKYSITKTDSPSTRTQSQYGSLFYTVRLGENLSVSLKGGPEYSTTSVPGSAPINSWAPSGTVGIGWQEKRANLALDYSRAVTTGWGLLGAYTTDTAGVGFEWLFSKRLEGGVNGNYANTQTTTPLLVSGSQLGHMLYGRASMQYMFSERVSLVGEYGRLHEDFGGVAAVQNDPDADRFAVTLNVNFMKALGR
jgi:hypothetical protein